MDAHVGDRLEPLSSGRVDVAEVDDLEAGQEVLLDVTDAGLDTALLVTGADIAGRDLEAVVAGEVDIAGVEHRRLPAQALQHRGLQIVDHDLARYLVERLEGVHVAAEEVLHRLRDGELHVHQAAVAEHHHEEAQLPAGIADGDRSVLPPVHLGALAGLEVQRQERRRLVRSHALDVLPHDADAAGEAVLAQALEDLRAGVGIVFQPLPDERLVGIELARPLWLLAWPVGRFVEPVAHGLWMQAELPGDLGEGELVDLVQVMDVAVGGTRRPVPDPRHRRAPAFQSAAPRTRSTLGAH